MQIIHIPSPIRVLKWTYIFKVYEEPEEIAPEEPVAEVVEEPEPAAPPKGSKPDGR